MANPITGAGIAAAVYSGKLAGQAAVAVARGEASAAPAYEEELRDVLGGALERAVRRRAALAEAVRRGAGKEALRSGWIAYPQYWATHAEEASMSAQGDPKCKLLRTSVGMAVTVGEVVR